MIQNKSRGQKNNIFIGTFFILFVFNGWSSTTFFFLFLNLGTFSCQVQPTQCFSTTQTIAQKVSNIKTQTFTKTHSIGIQTENESENSFDLTNITKLDPEATFDLSLSLRKVELSQQVEVPAAPTEEELENNYQQIKTQREIEGNSEINDSILELLFKKRDQILSDINLIETALDIINWVQ